MAQIGDSQTIFNSMVVKSLQDHAASHEKLLGKVDNIQQDNRQMQDAVTTMAHLLGQFVTQNNANPAAVNTVNRLNGFDTTRLNATSLNQNTNPGNGSSNDAHNSSTGNPNQNSNNYPGNNPGNGSSNDAHNGNAGNSNNYPDNNSGNGNDNGNFNNYNNYPSNNGGNFNGNNNSHGGNGNNNNYNGNFGNSWGNNASNQYDYQNYRENQPPRRLTHYEVLEKQSMENQMKEMPKFSSRDPEKYNSFLGTADIIYDSIESDFVKRQFTALIKVKILASGEFGTSEVTQCRDWYGTRCLIQSKYNQHNSQDQILALIRSHNQRSNESMYDYTIKTKRLADQYKNSFGEDLNPTVRRSIEKTMIEQSNHQRDRIIQNTRTNGNKRIPGFGTCNSKRIASGYSTRAKQLSKRGNLCLL